MVWECHLIYGKIFDNSTSTTRVGTSGEKGTGFGMPLVKGFVDKFGAEIDVSSEENEGTEFTLRFKQADYYVGSYSS